jgi:hypothetical protein
VTVSLAVTMCVGAIVTGGPMYLAVPWLAAACYAIAIGILWTEVAALKRAPAPTTAGA